MSNKLNLYHKDQHVGVLQLYEHSQKFDFVYTRKWKEKGFEISPYITFDKVAQSGSIKKFLDNLLPEGKALDVFNLFFQITKNNTLALINEIGNETSGALTFFSKELLKPKTTQRPISLDELTRRIVAQDPIQLIIWDGKPRLSVAGVQDKLPLIYHDGMYSFGEGNLASTHILKFETDRQRHLVINEYICMKLAKAAGLQIAQVEIKHFADKPALLVTRFDRKRISDQEIQRLHIIDGCQALDLAPTHKYERNMGSGKRVKHIRDGISFSKLFDFSKRCKNPIKTKLQIFQWTLFNLLISNSDAHGKNISFFATRGGYELTPFYDIVSIAMYPEFEQELSMAFGDNFSLDIKADDIATMCKENGIHLRLAAKELKTLCNNVIRAIQTNDFITLCTNDDEKSFANTLIKNTHERALKYLTISDELRK